MKTYKDLLKQDYDYLDSLRYGIGKSLKIEKHIIQPVVFDPKLSDLHNLYIREGVTKHKNMMLDCIEECIGLLYSALCEDKNNE